MTLQKLSEETQLDFWAGLPQVLLEQIFIEYFILQRASTEEVCNLIFTANNTIIKEILLHPSLGISHVQIYNRICNRLHYKRGSLFTRIYTLIQGISSENILLIIDSNKYNMQLNYSSLTFCLKNFNVFVPDLRGNANKQRYVQCCMRGLIYNSDVDPELLFSNLSPGLISEEIWIFFFLVIR
jgi:hypothetical protein